MKPVRIPSVIRGLLLLVLLGLIGLSPEGFSQQKKKKDDKKKDEIRLTSVTGMFPPGAKAGSTVPVKIGGERLAGAKMFWCEHPGVKAKIKGESSDTEVEAELSVAANVPPGLYQWRVIAERGASPPRFLAVSGGEDQLEKEPNDDMEKAQPLPIEGSVNGNLEKYKDVDLYKVAGKSGERVLIITQAQTLGVSAEVALAVIDNVGKPLALGTQFMNGDPYIDFTFPHDGEVYVQVWNLTPGDQAGRVYRLTVTKLPLLQYVFPPGGPKGKSVELKVGVIDPSGKLKGTPDGKFSVVTIPYTIPADAPPEIPFRIPKQRTFNSLSLAVGELAELQEKEGNDDIKSANPVKVPAVINGRFPTRGDVDYYKITAAKDRKLVLDATARKLGYRGDLTVAVLDKDGKELAQNNDRSPDQFDPRLEFTAPEDGDYYVRIQEVVPRRCKGPKFIYRLAIREPLPDFRLTVNQATPFMKPGEGVIVVNVDRFEGFDGEVQFTIQGLPNDVKVEPAKAGPGENQVQISITAPVSRNNQHFPITIVGKAKVGDRELTRYAEAQVPLVTVGNIVRSSFPTSKLFLSITDRDLGPPPPPLGVGTIAASSAGWKYIASKAVKDKNWFQPKFNDGKWKPAKTPVGYGENVIKEKKGTTLPLQGQNVYFRREFNLDKKVLKPGTKFKLYVASDNSALVWINGKQVDKDTADHEVMYWNRTVDVPGKVFVQGRNVVAVQLTNSSGSSDAVFDLQLDAQVPQTSAKKKKK